MDTLYLAFQIVAFLVLGLVFLFVGLKKLIEIAIDEIMSHVGK